MTSATDYTEDTFYEGCIKCLQHRKGYRFSVDSVLLGNFIQPRPGDRILDLGSGCGIISLILAYRWPNVSITGLEIQPNLASLARKNVELNNWQDRIEILPGDLKEIKKYRYLEQMVRKGKPECYNAVIVSIMNFGMFVNVHVPVFN